MTKGKKKSRRRSQEDDHDSIAEERQETEDIFKNLLDLNADELKKEAFKLGLYVDGDKPRKDQALTKLTAFLSRSGINVETFKFSPNGATKFPAPLLSQNRPRTASAKSGTSSSDSSAASSSEVDEPSLAGPSRPPSGLKKKKKRSKTNSPSSKVGYETIVNPVTGVPVGIVSRSTGQFFNIAIPGSAPVVTSPASLTTTQVLAPPPPVSQLSGQSGFAGHGTGSAFRSLPENTGSAQAQTDNANLDICGISIPGFAQNKPQHSGSSCTKKLTSGMFCTGRKEVKQKIVWPHHCVNSIIKPNGVEYDVMNWQELTNGFTGLILSKVNSETIQPEVLNMLRHLNLISGYGMFAPIKTVLDFNAGLMLGIENMSQDWFNWTRLKQYHDQHLHSLKLSTNLSEGQSATKPAINLMLSMRGTHKRLADQGEARSAPKPG